MFIFASFKLVRFDDSPEIFNTRSHTVRCQCIPTSKFLFLGQTPIVSLASQSKQLDCNDRISKDFLLLMKAFVKYSTTN